VLTATIPSTQAAGTTYVFTNTLNTANVIVEVYNSSGVLQVPSATGAITSITVTATQVSVGVGTAGTYQVVVVN